MSNPGLGCLCLSIDGLLRDQAIHSYDRMQTQGWCELHGWPILGPETQKWRESFLDQKIEVWGDTSYSTPMGNWHPDETSEQIECPCTPELKMDWQDCHGAKPWCGKYEWHVHTSMGGCALLCGTKQWYWVGWEDLLCLAHVIGHMWCSWHARADGDASYYPWCWHSSDHLQKIHARPHHKWCHEHGQVGGLWAMGESPIKCNQYTVIANVFAILGTQDHLFLLPTMP